eukprot:gene14372-4230_t
MWIYGFESRVGAIGLEQWALTHSIPSPFNSILPEPFCCACQGAHELTKNTGKESTGGNEK